MKHVLILAFVLAACGEDEGHNENELITTVQLTFTPQAGAAVIAEYNDLDGDGGDPPTADPINLASATSYALTVRFLNRLVMPEEDITVEVEDESTDHQVFLTGSAVAGPATMLPSAPLAHAYADMDANGLPIGLANTIMTTSGSGQLIVTLRHMPANQPPGKTACAAVTVAGEGFSALGGTTDATATFAVTIP